MNMTSSKDNSCGGESGVPHIESCLDTTPCRTRLLNRGAPSTYECYVFLEEKINYPFGVILLRCHLVCSRFVVADTGILLVRTPVTTSVQTTYTTATSRFACEYLLGKIPWSPTTVET